MDLFKSFVGSSKEKLPLRSNTQGNQSGDGEEKSTRKNEAGGILQGALKTLSKPKDYWHSKLESTYGDSFNPDEGFAQHLRQTALVPWENLRNYVDEGRPQPAAATPQELERDAAWKRSLEPVSSDAKGSYVYEPLQPSGGKLLVRLVTLLPGDDLDDIDLKLHCLDLLESPEYEALSYCWGDPSIRTSVKCNDGLLNVTINLKEALLHLRHRSEERVIWIDAICINQEDLQERAQQVGIMREIYETSSKVVVWLGKEENNSGLGIELCEKLNDFFEIYRDREFNWRTLAASSDEAAFNPASSQTDEGDYKKKAPEELTQEKETEKEDLYEKSEVQAADETETKQETGQPSKPLRMNPPNVYELLALRDLASRQWFQRIWIVQEIALAPEAILVCGHRSITWEEFIFGFGMTFINGAEASGGWNPDKNYIGTLVQIRKYAHTAGSTHNEGSSAVLDILHECRTFESTDPRDKIYGLLGIASRNSGGAFIDIDYSKSVESVYLDTAKRILSTSENLDFLSIHRGPGDLAQRLPSWVPDWTYRRIQGMDLVFSSKPQENGKMPARTFSASKDSSQVPSFRGRSLVLSGHMVDRISEVSSIITPPVVDQLEMKLLSQKLDDKKDAEESKVLAGMAAYFDVLMEIEDLARPLDQDLVYPTNESRNRAFWRTLCTDVAPGELDAAEAAFLSWQKGMKAPRFLKKYRVNKFAGLYNYLAAVGQGVTDIIYDGDGQFGVLLKAAWFSRFAITEKGYFALVSATAKAGDEVAIFKGGRVPLLVRRQAEQWCLLGETYVHGIMHGEAFDENACKEMEIV
ncbi:heterokaryon incompatibility protein-domain-containing protein [Xylogone sp. PMI_703]|nr:heterokaryon incompatibility protein-domain-containing protein [Xylogone sp. PMI_703]